MEVRIRYLKLDMWFIFIYLFIYLIHCFKLIIYTWHVNLSKAIIILIFILINKMIVIQHKYRQMTRGSFQARLSENFGSQPKRNLRKVFSQIKLETSSKEKPRNRHSPERSQTQPEYLSIDKYTSWQLSLISVYETCTIKNSTVTAGEVTTR